jgi:hypothetical protein
MWLRILRYLDALGKTDLDRDQRGVRKTVYMLCGSSKGELVGGLGKSNEANYSNVRKSFILDELALL